MAGERRLFQRQLGGYSTAGYPLASAGATWGHQPATFQRDVCADVAFLKRLKITSELEGHSGPVSTLDWNAEGTLLLSGSDDCKVNIWDVSRSRAQHSIDSGHTAVVYAAKFLPNTNDEHIITCSADRQVRLINLQKSAIRPFNVHRGKVKALAIMDQHVFLSGSEDGTVRRFDTRIAPQAGNQGQPGSQDSAYVLADQRQERHARNNRAKVGVNSLSIDPMRPHLFITGGSDPLVRLFDQRMISVADPTERSSSRRPQWISCYVPTHLKASLQQVQRSAFGPPVRSYNVTSATFSHSGDEVFASYSAEQIYCFRAVDHARSSASMAAAVEGQTRQAPVQHSRTRPSSGRRQAEGASFTAARASAAGQRAGPAAQAGEGGQAAAAAARTSREQRQALQQLVQQRITRHAARQASQADALPGAGSAPAAQDRHGMAATAAAMAEAEAMAEADAAAAATTAAMEVDDAAGMEQRPPVQPTLASLTEQADAPASPWQGFRDRFRFRRGQERTQQGQADAPQTSTEAQGTPDVQPPSSGEAAAGPSRAAGAEGAAGRTSSLGLLRRHSLSFLGWPAAQAESPQAQNAPGIGTAEPQAGAAPGGRPRAAQSATDIATNQAQGCTAPAADDAALNSDAAMQDGDAHRRSKRKAEESAPTPDSRPATRGRLARRSADEHAASTSNAASHLATGCVAAAPAVPAGPVSQTEQSQPAVDPTRRAASGLVAAAEPAVHARAPSSQQAQLAGEAEQNATGTQFAVREGLGLAARPAGTAAAAPGGVQPAGTAAEQRPAAEERQRQAHELSVLDIANAVVDHMEASLRAGQLPSEFSMEADFLLPFERPARRRRLDDGPGRAEARGGGRAEQRPGGRARDANVGAICQDDDEGDEEEVEECGMFQTRYTGHRNMMSAKQVALMGGHSEYVVSGSDDGRVFVWNRYTGALVNLLQSDADDADVHAVNCVAPHPIAPMLATAGAQPIVKLWSPEAEDMATLENAEAVMRTNAAELAEGERAAAQRPLWLNMTMGNVRRNMQRGDAEDDLDRVTPAGVRCSIM
ncbi:hypothetical protein WJX72_004226 [[Myrmecia] bisecta]|uniref:Uncharacterized protein n=1 Tax=[Myrmecia] bisecta TaxID=41462 RepID=A0AAW1R5Q2_9CHLO